VWWHNGVKHARATTQSPVCSLASTASPSSTSPEGLLVPLGQTSASESLKDDDGSVLRTFHYRLERPSQISKPSTKIHVEDNTARRPELAILSPLLFLSNDVRAQSASSNPRKNRSLHWSLYVCMLINVSARISASI
jgi:hypothetical protein